MDVVLFRSEVSTTKPGTRLAVITFGSEQDVAGRVGRSQGSPWGLFRKSNVFMSDVATSCDGKHIGPVNKGGVWVMDMFTMVNQEWNRCSMLYFTISMLTARLRKRDRGFMSLARRTTQTDVAW